MCIDLEKIKDGENGKVLFYIVAMWESESLFE